MSEAPPGYRLLARIAQGGMAEVFLAERAGAEGVTKIVALKWLLPNLAHDHEFVKMFLNEARIAVDLSHANVVSTFEFGEALGRYYMAMEYVRGHNLAKILQASASAAEPMPPPVAVLVAAEVAKGLAYAHERRDDAGHPLGIVHRDVSPANVLVSLEGEVKLADFGIARAAASSSITSQGWVKGKIPYMSPEQARGETLDARSDIYSLGIILYELVTAERWVSGKDEMAMLAEIRRARAPSFERDALPGVAGHLHPTVPRALAPILAQALAPDRDARFASARELAQALSRALAQLGGVSAEDLRQYVATLTLPAPLDPAQHRKAGPSGTMRSPEAAAAAPKQAPARPAVPRARRAAVTAAIGLASALVAAAVAAGARTAVRRAAAPAPARLEVRSEPAGARVHVAGVDRGATPLVLDDVAPAELVVTIEAPGHVGVSERVDLAAHPSIVLEATLPRDGSSPSTPGP